MSQTFDTYQLLDCGDFKKLEQVGPYRLIRPSPAAVWSTSLPQNEWEKAHSTFYRDSTGNGEWRNSQDLPTEWTLKLAEIKFIIRPTQFGHLGVFLEQEKNWGRLYELAKPQGAEDLPILNLFAYTGGSTLAAARAGASVVHLDASKTSVGWARENARQNQLEEAPIRWITDDVTKFVEREVRRGNQYRGIILDPPSYGQGPKKQAWKIEKHLISLLRNCKKILRPQQSFVIFTCHSPGYTPQALENLLVQMLGTKSEVQSEEMVISSSTGQPLPSGAGAIAQI